MLETVRDVMMPEPWTVDSRTSLEQAAHLMRSWDVREVLVTNDDDFCGVLRDSDIIVIAIASGCAPTTVTAGECANRDAPRLEGDHPVGDAVDYLRRHDLRYAPVVDGDHLIGRVWTTDLARVAARQPSRCTRPNTGGTADTTRPAHATPQRPASVRT
jgi:CBS domain-containing protein